MTDEALLTLRQLAEELEIPESTARYYRDAFLDHIPSVGTGRRRRYPPEAVAVLRSIATSYSAGRSRTEIIAGIHGGPGASTTSVRVTAPEAQQRTVPLDDVTNLDLLAAILDGERDQRDALWQMAKEIVRLTEVLASQDKVISEIADQAGVSLGTPAPVAQLKNSSQTQQTHQEDRAQPPQSAPFLSHEISPPPALTPSFLSGPPAPFAERVSASSHIVDAHVVEHGNEVEVEPLPRFSASGDVDKLRAELETERALVEKLREGKLQLEHRAADAEAALEDRKGRRSSMIRRILGSEPEK
ncbi:MAG TPA: MerR family transcriptional regulator [Gemmatimonadales bacterium]|jgi:DNA-binding transcriptional MerR regulator